MTEFDEQLRNAFASTHTVERELVGGGMSRVFVATERALNRRVVIKVLPPDLAAGVNRERFRREIQFAAQLQHPHIVPLYAAGEYGDLLYYTMPFIEGESLKHALHGGATPGRLTPKEVAGILHDVVDALAYAHTGGVIHRDIKPGNVLRSGRHAVVTDFGVAKAISAAMPAAGMTMTGMAIGTPAYMAPEQLAGDPAADHRVDIYAVGLLGYELLTGEGPFAEASPQQTLAAQLTRDPQPIDRARLDVPPALSAIIMRCLAKAPEKRPQSAADLLADLELLSLESGNYRPQLPPRRRRYTAVTTGIAALAAVTAIWLVARQPARPAASPANGARDSAARGSSAAPGAMTPRQDAPHAAALTHADSLAIAQAVERRIRERAPAKQPQSRADSATLAQLTEQLRADVQRSVFDSLTKIREARPAVGGVPGMPAGAASIEAMVEAATASASRMGMGRGATNPLDQAAFDRRAATMGPPRRVVVADHRPDRRNTAMQEAGTAIMDALRKRLAAGKRFAPVDRDSTLAVLARTRVRDSVSTILSADMTATISGVASSGDTVTWMLSVYDLSAVAAYRQRLVSLRGTTGNVQPTLDSLVGLAVHTLEEIDRAPRRSVTTLKDGATAAPPARPTPEL